MKQLTAAARSPSTSAQPPPSTSGNMIVNLEVAERNLTPKALYVMNEMRMTRATDFASLNRKESASGKVAAGKKWDTLRADEREVWELERRNRMGMV